MIATGLIPALIQGNRYLYGLPIDRAQIIVLTPQQY